MLLQSLPVLKRTTSQAGILCGVRTDDEETAYREAADFTGSWLTTLFQRPIDVAVTDPGLRGRYLVLSHLTIIPVGMASAKCGKTTVRRMLALLPRTDKPKDIVGTAMPVELDMPWDDISTVIKGWRSVFQSTYMCDLIDPFRRPRTLLLHFERGETSLLGATSAILDSTTADEWRWLLADYAPAWTATLQHDLLPSAAEAAAARSGRRS